MVIHLFDLLNQIPEHQDPINDDREIKLTHFRPSMTLMYIGIMFCIVENLDWHILFVASQRGSGKLHIFLSWSHLILDRAKFVQSGGSLNFTMTLCSRDTHRNIRYVEFHRFLMSITKDTTVFLDLTQEVPVGCSWSSDPLTIS